MNSSLRILHLEDDRNDAELVQAALEEGGIACHVTRVETRADFLAALENSVFDLVLADYTLPSFDGLSALAIVEEKYPEIPFIFISGVMGEELAIETIKDGATDYVLKKRLSRIVPVVNRALEEVRTRTECRKAEGALESLRHQNELILRSIGEGVLGLDIDGKHTFVNPAAAEMLGYKVEELLGKSSHKIWHQCKEDGSPYPEKDCPIYMAYRDGIVHRVRNEVFWRKDGTSFPVAYTSTPILENGELGGAVVTFRDITERKLAEEELKRHRNHLEELVEARTSELEEMNEHLQEEIIERIRAEEELKRVTDELRRSNADLQQFAYAASHDLQEPLRAVDGFAKLLEKRYKGKLDAKANEFIEYIVDGIKRMQLLIRDLLAYSQVETKEKTFQATNCSEVLEQALLNLHSTIEESGVKLTYDILPMVMADPSQLIRLFQNLIGNAIKFRGERPLKIHISAEQKRREWIFSVCDNGIGIDPKQFERIFIVFQRLHTREQYDGTGIGLSICNKIVEHHGGRIWVESEVGRGSTFYFTIPAME